MRDGAGRGQRAGRSFGGKAKKSSMEGDGC